MNIKYILCGSEAVRRCHEGDYDAVGVLIKDRDADVFDFSSLNEIDELLEQLKGWNDFTCIERTQYFQIIRAFNKLHRL